MAKKYQNGQKITKWPKNTKMAKSDPNMTQNGSGMTQNDPKWPKNDPKWPKMAKNDPI